VRRALGIDLGSRWAKAVRLERTAAGLSVLGFAEEAIPAAETDPVRLRKLALDAGWRGEPVAAAVSGLHTIVRRLSLPHTQTGELARVVEFEAGSRLPLPPDRAVLDYVVLGQETESTEVMVFAAPREVLSALLAVFGRAGLDPCLVSVEPVALLEAVRATSPVYGEATLLLDLGASCAKAVVLEGGRPAYARVIHVGGASADGTGDAPSRYRRKLTRELVRMLAAAAPSAPRAVVATGGRATEETVDALGGALGLEVAGAGVSCDFFPEPLPEEVAQRGLVALGLALSLLGGAAFDVNLRKGEFRYRPKLEKVARPLMFLLAGAAALAAVCAVGLESRRRAYLEAERRFGQEEGRIWASLSQTGPTPEDLAGWLEAEERRLRALVAAGSGDDRFSALQALGSILGAVPRRVPVTVGAIDVTPHRVRIAMATGSHTDAAAIASAVTKGTAWRCSPRNLRYEAGKSVFELEAVPSVEGSDAG
jgi:hypothetical protein